jgi:hypothetical protein
MARKTTDFSLWHGTKYELMIWSKGDSKQNHATNKEFKTERSLVGVEILTSTFVAARAEIWPLSKGVVIHIESKLAESSFSKLSDYKKIFWENSVGRKISGKCHRVREFESPGIHLRTIDTIGDSLSPVAFFNENGHILIFIPKKSAFRESSLEEIFQ